MEHLVLFLAGVGETDVSQRHVGVPDISPLFRLGKLRHFQKLLQILHGELHLPHVFGEHLQLGQGAYHGDGQHDGQRGLRGGDGALSGQRQRHRQRADEGGGEQGEAQLHGGKGGGQPFHHEGAEIVDGGGVLLIADAGTAEGLDDLNALDVLHDGAVHVVGGLVIFLEVLAADLEGQAHAEEGQGERHQRGQRQTPVDAQQRDDADDRQHHMARALGDHVGQGRLQIFDLVHHHALDLADGVVLYVAQRRVEEAVGQPQAQTLQNGIGHGVGGAGEQAEQQDLHHVGQQRQQAPSDGQRRRGRPVHEQTDERVHAVERHKAQHDAEHRQHDGQGQALLFTAGIGEKRACPAFLFGFHTMSSFLLEFWLD